MKIEQTDPAVSDIEGIKEYIARDSEYYAALLVEKIINAVENLKQFPGIGRMVPEAKNKSIREILLRNYRIIYRVERERIVIPTVIHGSRDLTRKKPEPWEII